MQGRLPPHTLAAETEVPEVPAITGSVPVRVWEKQTSVRGQVNCIAAPKRAPSQPQSVKPGDQANIWDKMGF